MQTVNHKKYGVGEIINKEVKGYSICITVRFENGLESRFSIPESFEIGALTANGSLIEEVEAAIAEKNLRKQEKLHKPDDTTEVTHSSTAVRHGRKASKPVTVKGPVETAYEAYLIDAGYETQTPSGAPSTVYSYSGAISKNVLDEEHITWQTLADDIDNIIKKYDVGGSKEHIGAKSNKTVINALRRFKEFVSLSPSL